MSSFILYNKTNGSYFVVKVDSEEKAYQYLEEVASKYPRCKLALYKQIAEAEVETPVKVTRY